MKPNETNVPKLIQLIVDKLGVDENLLSYKTSFSEDLGADSLDVYELIMTVEKEFKVKVSEDEIEKLTTVGALMDYVTGKNSLNKPHSHSSVVITKELHQESTQNVLLQSTQS